jgi:trimeric autotransporter adhesin
MPGRIYRVASNGDPANAIVYSNGPHSKGFVHIQSVWRKATINDIVGSLESSNPWVTDGWVKIKSVWRYTGSGWDQVFSGFDLPAAIQPLPDLVDISGDNTYIDTTETIYLNRGGWSEEPNYYKLEIQKGDNYLNSPWTTIESVELDENSSATDFISYKIRRADAVDTTDASNTSSNFASRFRGRVIARTPGTLEGIYYTKAIVPHLQILGTVTGARAFADGSAEITWDLFFDGPTETGTGAINTVTSSHVNGGYIELTNSLTQETFGTYTVANNSDVNTKFTLPAGTIPTCLSGTCPEYGVTVVLYARDAYKFEDDPFDRTIISMNGDLSITPPQPAPTIGSVEINELDLNNQGGLIRGRTFSVDYFNDLNTDGAVWSYKLYRSGDTPIPVLEEANDTGMFNYISNENFIGEEFYVVVKATTEWGSATATTPSYVLYAYPTLTTIGFAAGPTLNGITRIALFYDNYPKKVTVSWDDIDNTTQELNTIYIYPTNKTGLINPSYVYTTPGTKTIMVEVDPRPDTTVFGQTLKTKDAVLDAAPLAFNISSFTKGFPNYGNNFDLRPLVASWDASDGASTYKYKIQGSNDKVNWATLRDYTLTGDSGSENFISESLAMAKYYRIYIKAFSTTGTYETSASNDGFEATGTNPGIPTSIVVTPSSTSASVAYSNTLNKGSNQLSGIQYKLGVGSNPDVSLIEWSNTISFTPFTITITAGTSYTLYMRSVNDDGLFSDSTTGTTFTALSKPINTLAPVLSQPSYSSSGLSVTSGSWSPTADSYTYIWYNEDFVEPVRTITKTATTDTYTSAVGQSYRVTVTANKSGLSSDPASSNSLTTSKVPDAPYLNATNITYTTALISWFTPSSNGQPIDYYQWSLNGTTWSTSGISYNNTTSMWEYNFSDSITSTRSKTFYVRAHNSIGFSTNGSVSFSLLATSRPGQPTGVTPIDVGTNRPYNDGSITVSWDAPAFDGGYPVTKYKVEYSYSDNTTTWYTLSDTLTGTSVTSSPWGSGLSVRFRVSAYNQVDWSLTSTASSYVTVTTVPQSPTINFVDDASGDGSVSVYLSANATGGKTISSYSVSTNGGGGTGSSGLSSPLSITGLTNGTEYTAYATTTNANGTSALSAGVKGMPFGNPSISVSSLTDVGFDLSWSSSGATNYYVDVYNTSTLTSASGFPLTSTTNTSASVSGLSANTAYTIVVYGKKTVGSTPYMSTYLNTSQTTLRAGLVSTFGTNTRTAGGFIGSITNYDPANYNYLISTNLGSVSFGTATGNVRPFTVTGVAQNQLIAVSVTAYGRSGYASAVGTTYAYAADAPGAPTIGTATASTSVSTRATVSFTAPSSNGGAAITSYTATSTPGGLTGTLNQAGSGTITVDGLSEGTAYTFRVTATNAAGTSTASSASNSITTYRTIPSGLTGLSQSTATTYLQSIGFVVAIGSPVTNAQGATAANNGTVFSQTPFYGQSGVYIVPVGTTFTLRIYEYTPPPSAFAWSILNGSPTPTTPSNPTFTRSGNTIYISWASSKPADTTYYDQNVSGAAYGTTMTTSWSTVNNYGSGPVFNYPTGPYEDFITLSASANNSPLNSYVTAYGSSRKALIAWGASTNANSYKINYTISGATTGNGTFTTGVITGTSQYIDTTANGGTVTVNSVTAYTGTDGTGQSTAGTMDQGPSITPAFQTSTSGTTTTNFTYTAPSYSYSISFNANGGSGTMTALSGTASSVTLTANSFTRTGYTFAGWNTVSGGTGTSYANQAVVSITASTTITLYAQWTVSSAPSGGSVSWAASNVTVGQTITVGTVPGGWSPPANSYDLKIIRGTAGVVIYETQVAPTAPYTGSGPLSYTIQPGDVGYYFKGFVSATNSIGTSEYVSSSEIGPVVAAPVTLYSVTFNSSGATSGSPSVSSVTQTSSAGSVTLATIGTMVKSGYRFAGWSIDGGMYASGGTYTPPANVTATPIWIQQFTVTWAANGGTVSPASNTVDTGISVTAPTPTRSGYNFSNWRYPASGGDPIFISAGGTYVPTVDITFTAIWTLVSAPATPTAVGLTGSGVVSWTASTGSPTSYEIEFYTAQDGAGTGVTGPHYVTGISASPYQLVSPYVSPNNYARVRVRAVNAGGASAYSAWRPTATTYT